jgi:3-methyladenine DNA glycosylase AlkC
MTEPTGKDGVPRQIFDRAVIARIARCVAAVHAPFPTRRFVRRAGEGLDALGLRARSGQIADALAESLPADFAGACAIVTEALGPPGPAGHETMSAGFWKLPFLDFVERHGLGDPDHALAALGDLTRHFSAEFAIRPFLLRYPDMTWTALWQWSGDEDWRRRRLASEGCRPRLPWGIRLRTLIDDPAPVIALLDRLHADEEEIVRRSVANNLNDVAKDHPALAVDVAGRWLRAGAPASRLTVRHALRTLVKAGDARALELLGFTGGDGIVVRACSLEPAAPRIGGKAVLRVSLESRAREPTRLVVDYVFDRLLASGRRGTKVFKLTQLELAPGQRSELSRLHDVSQRTTRRHYAGPHGFRIQINGREAGSVLFELGPEAGAPGSRGAADA